MRRINRPDSPPVVLSHPDFARMRRAYLEFLRLPEERRAQTRPPDRRLPDVPGLLAAVAEPFDGLCAFCGIEVAREVYRFRPTGYVNGDFDQLDLWLSETALKRPGSQKIPMTIASGGSSHTLHYGWLADAWQNLYPICARCHPMRPEVFPVMGDRAPLPAVGDYEIYAMENTGRWPEMPEEEHLLLDPQTDDPGQHIRQEKSGVLTGLSVRGTFTILMFNLNRPTLIERRVGPTTNALPTRKPRAPRAPKLPLRWELARIGIVNFKAIERLELDMPNTPAVPPDGRPRATALLILGENAAGKSSILEAVALAMMGDAARRKLVKDPGALLLNPRFMGDAETPSRSEGRVTLHFVAGADEATVTLHLAPEGLRAESTAKGLPQIFAYGAYRLYLHGVRGRGADRGVVSLFKPDSLLSNPRDWLLALPEERFNEVVQALRFVFGVDFEAIRLRGTDCVVVTRTEGLEQETPLLAVSSGFRTVLALVCDVLRWLMEAPATRALKLEAMPALILIDEVEAHLHPRWKMAIVDGLRQALPAATFLISTHDPLCLRRAAPGEVRVMTRQRGTSATELPVMLEALDRLPDMGALTVDQLLTADFFGLGDTDDPASVQALENLMAQYASGVADTGGSDVVIRLQKRLLQDLPIGRTEVERIVQEAVQAYLSERRSDRPEWRAATRAKILGLLRAL